MLLSFFVVSFTGCAWIDRHDPPIDYHYSASCADLGDEPCGTSGCCHGWQDYHCMPMSQRCEYAPPIGVSKVSSDAGNKD